MFFLGIETSCDECSAAIVDVQSIHPFRPVVKSVSTFSQIKLHQPYGGVVPEIASRNHLETINSMISQALVDAKCSYQDIEAIGVTNRPGLVGALLVGVSAAKALSYALKKPLLSVHHLEGHALSVYLDQPETADMSYPALFCIVSGGHTNLYLVKEPPAQWSLDFLKTTLIGRSRDDAAGEAFDKSAKLLSFPYPGGQWIDRFAQNHTFTHPPSFRLPRALPQKTTYDFSFSGLKTAVKTEIENLKRNNSLKEKTPELCYAIQQAIIDALCAKIKLAIQNFNCQSLVIVGGVAANHYFRQTLESQWKSFGLRTPAYFPKLKYCTDNAAMIAAAGALRYHQGYALKAEERLTLNAIANPEV